MSLRMVSAITSINPVTAFTLFYGIYMRALQFYPCIEMHGKKFRTSKKKYAHLINNQFEQFKMKKYYGAI